MNSIQPTAVLILFYFYFSIIGYFLLMFFLITCTPIWIMPIKLISRMLKPKMTQIEAKHMDPAFESIRRKLSLKATPKKWFGKRVEKLSTLVRYTFRLRQREPVIGKRSPGLVSSQLLLHDIYIFSDHIYTFISIDSGNQVVEISPTDLRCVGGRSPQR